MTETRLRQPLPWHATQWATLELAQQQGRLPHALLLAGAAGSGKRWFADALAYRLMCLQPQAGVPCGRCKGCHLNLAGTHPDFITVAPEEAGKPIRIDQVRSLIEQLGGVSQQGGYRIILLDPADSMNINSANALLKVLEEPGQRTLFLLVSSAPSQVMATIRSRCQLLRLPSAAPDQAARWLAETHGVTSPEPLLAAAQGAPLRALQYQENDSLALRERLLSQLGDLWQQRADPLSVAAEWQKLDLDTLLPWWQEWLVALIKATMAPASAAAQEAGLQRLVTQLGKRPETKHLFQVADKLGQYRGMMIARSNPNKQMLLEDLLIDWTQLPRHRA